MEEKEKKEKENEQESKDKATVIEQIDELKRKYINGEISDKEFYMEMGKLEERLERLKEIKELDKLKKKYEEFEGDERIRNLNDKIAKLEARFDDVEAKVTTLLEKLEKIEKTPLKKSFYEGAAGLEGTIQGFTFGEVYEEMIRKAEEGA